ncbi:MAG: acylphosphatase [Candidatus Hodarchaeota archaeon]
MKSVKILVSGRVQGVFFRVYTQRFARELQDVTGYVKNLHDGRVEIMAEGSEFSLRKLVEWAQNKGSPASQVTKIAENWEEINERQYSDFSITY